MQLYRNLKRANNLLTYEAMALSERNKALIKLEAVKKAQIRKNIVKHANLKIQWDKQGKHIVGHKNYVSSKSRSIFEHKNSQKLVYAYAGKGIKVNNLKPGTAGYKEIVNFEEFVGYVVNSETEEKIATSWGKIHYAKGYFMEINSIAYALLATQGALFDAITPELRAVTIDLDEKNNIFYLRFYHEGKAPDKLIELWQCVATEASANFVEFFEDQEIIRLDAPNEIPIRGRLAYLRMEDQVNLDAKFLNRELVNFEEFIGYSINRISNERMKTNWGIIHYSTDGSHIIPAYSGEVKDLNGGWAIAYAQLAMQNALLGAATPQLRAVIVDFSKEENLLYIRMYYDQQVSEGIINLWECAISETCADLGRECIFDVKVERIDWPQQMPVRGRYAYSRKE